MPSRLPKSGRAAAIGVAALLVGAVILSRLSRSAPATSRDFLPRRAGAASAVQPMGAFPGAAGGGLGLAGGNGLGEPGASAPGSGNPITLDEFLGLLSETAPPELAEKMKQEFRKDIKLQQAWNVYKNVAGPKAPAAEFVAFITRIPQFRQLVARFQQEPGFKQAFTSASRRPEVGGILRDGLKSFAGAKGGAGARSADSSAIAREWERKAVSGVRLSKIKMAGAGPVGGGAGRGSGPVAASAAVPAGEGAAATLGGPESGPPSQAALAGQKPGPAAHNATELKKGWQSDQIDDDANFVDNRKWLTKFLLALSESTRKAVQAKLESGAEDLWGACYITGNFDECRGVCQKVPEAKCENKDRWEACRSANTRDATACVLACKGSDAKLACDPDLDEWNPVCVAKDVPRNYCLSSQPWGPSAYLPELGKYSQDYGTLDGGSGAGGITSAPVTGDVATCGSEIEMASPPCQRLVALLAQIRAAQAAAAAAAAAAAGQPGQPGQTGTSPGSAGCMYGPCPAGTILACSGCVPNQCIASPQQQQQSGPGFFETALGVTGTIVGGPVVGRGAAWAGEQLDKGVKVVTDLIDSIPCIPIPFVKSC